MPDGSWRTPDSRACGGATRTRHAFSFYWQRAHALRWIQSSRIVVLLHKLERNHSCFDILLIYYLSLKIYFSGCFDEVREGCGCLQDNKGFSTNWSREVGYCFKNATTYLTTVRCRYNGLKRQMVDTPPSPTRSFIGVGVENHV